MFFFLSISFLLSLAKVCITSELHFCMQKKALQKEWGKKLGKLTLCKIFFKPHRSLGRDSSNSKGKSLRSCRESMLGAIHQHSPSPLSQLMCPNKFLGIVREKKTNSNLNTRILGITLPIYSQNDSTNRRKSSS